MTQEKVNPTPKRRAMTAARKRRIWTKQNGLCGCDCGEPVDLSGPHVRYDHTISFFIAPELDDDGPNVKAVRTICDAPKTYGQDIPTIAKIKRIIRKADPETRPQPKMQSRGFTRHPTMKRTLSGKVVPR